MFVDLRCLEPSGVAPVVGNRGNTSIELTWSAAGVASGCEGVVFDLAQVEYTVRYWVESEPVSTSKV